MTERPIVIQYEDGREYGVKDAATAAEKHPSAKIVRYQDGGPLEEEQDAPDPLLSKKRDELNEMATGLGVENPGGLENKQAVVDAIHAAEAAQAANQDAS